MKNRSILVGDPHLGKVSHDLFRYASVIAEDPCPSSLKRPDDFPVWLMDWHLNVSRVIS